MTDAVASKPTAKPASIRRKLAATMSMIKFAHTIFAMPFALMGWALGVSVVNRHMAAHPEVGDLHSRGLAAAGHEMGFADTPWLWTLAWVVIAMVGARSFAMAINRLVDWRIDAKNPRTAKREIPSGVLSPSFALWFALGSAAVFLLACWMLNDRTLVLGPVALLIVAGYSFTKRFTALCHVILGIGLCLAPVGGWLAAVGGPFDAVYPGGFAPFGWDVFGGTGAEAINVNPLVLAFHVVPGLLALGVLLWVAGFDIIYAMQDERFDREQGLHSIPAKLGAGAALLLSRVLHVGAFAAWIGALGYYAMGETDTLFGAPPIPGFEMPHGIGVMAFAGLLLVGLCLLYEHRLVKANDLSRVDAAFFTLNGIIALIFATMLVGDLFVF